MAGGFAPRFAVEAGFLILLAAGAGIADLRPLAIIGIVAGGWVLVSLLELVLWRAESQTRPIVYAPQPEAEAEPEPLPEPEPLDAEDEAGEAEEYPLRADVGLEPSEEAEAYTTVLAEQEAPAAEAAAAERGE